VLMGEQRSVGWNMKRCRSKVEELLFGCLSSGLSGRKQWLPHLLPNRAIAMHTLWPPVVPNDCLRSFANLFLLSSKEVVIFLLQL
jgi:hypothetical protein